MLFRSLHDLGKLLLGFSSFWAYLWVSQYLLIYAANLIEEIRQYWTFDRDQPGSALVDFPYAERDNFHQTG